MRCGGWCGGEGESGRVKGLRVRACARVRVSMRGGAQCACATVHGLNAQKNSPKPPAFTLTTGVLPIVSRMPPW